MLCSKTVIELVILYKDYLFVVEYLLADEEIFEKSRTKVAPGQGALKQVRESRENQNSASLSETSVGTVKMNTRKKSYSRDRASRAGIVGTSSDC